MPKQRENHTLHRGRQALADAAAFRDWVNFLQRPQPVITTEAWESYGELLGNHGEYPGNHGFYIGKSFQMAELFRFDNILVIYPEICGGFLTWGYPPLNGPFHGKSSKDG